MKIWYVLLLVFFLYFLFSQNHLGGCLSAIVNHFFLRENSFGITLIPNREMVTAWAVNLYDKFLIGGGYAV
ncbi:hypothetical protein J7E50_14980 [Pedobacter sp. ISL-68]|uniref:hypothetical protein n=1 Tax=unclassified Pedobacter TaxID=2628915 RepID=UPI001BE72AD4|nr:MULTISPECIES: hypothetical protein [unclassified Pedobacter]MBT2561944.1 hypothetical protein [Pedobacter sp. ISL-64]MBT2591531.1 hypothetical protein [Pedobacter sp. ISL-68]